MNRLDVALFLIQEAKEEKTRLENYNKDCANLPGYDDPNRATALAKFHSKHPKEPRKSLINDCLKLARRILVDEYV